MMYRTVVLAALASCALAFDLRLLSGADVNVRLRDHSTSGFDVIVERNGVPSTIAWIGRNVGPVTTALKGIDWVVSFANSSAKLHINSREVEIPNTGIVIDIEWRAAASDRLVDCVNLGSKNWYGGPQQKQQYWPIEKLVLSEYSYITKEADNCGIAEPYWLSSDGVYFFYHKKAPLFVDQNVMQQNSTCFIAQIKKPYSAKRDRLEVPFVIGIFNDVRQAHEHAVATVLGKPTGYPDERMLKYPIWSTWARYSRNINHNSVLAFADEITSHNFPNSQFEIDDLWEICYGSLTVDVQRFPNMSTTVRSLKAKGFRVTMWMHPFINKGCEPWYTDALDDKYLVLSESGSEETSWWNDNGTSASYIDFTKPEPRKWYIDRVRLLRDDYGIDSFKFDAGETSWSPQIPVLQSDIEGQPSAITTDYVRAVAQFGPLVEVRSGYGTQDLPIFVRMIDKDSYWTFNNGLPTLITTLLQMNLNGYTLVLPDMIGGNGYNDTKPTKELFVRWLQANVFMPSLQFSFVPWDYNDTEVIEISKKFVDLHAQYTPEIIRACQRSVADGSPVNAPIWWIAPNDTTAHAIWDEFLLGEDILAAPVVTNSVTRDIYLPAGKWRDQNSTDVIHEGPVWLRDYSAPLDVLPYFIRDRSVSAASTPYVAGLLLLLGLTMNMLYV